MHRKDERPTESAPSLSCYSFHGRVWIRKKLVADEGIGDDMRLQPEEGVMRARGGGARGTISWFLLVPKRSRIFSDDL
jgi:hypothetical protein